MGVFKIKKIVLTLVTMLLLVGCATTQNTEKTEVLPAASAETLQKAIPKKTYDMLYDIYGSNSYSMASMLNYVGKDIKDINMNDINGKKLNYEAIKGKKVVIEIVADWCEYCKTETKSHLDNIIKENEDTVFIQMFAEGNKAQIEAFYAAIEKEPNVEYLIPEEEVKTFAEDFGATAYPSFLFFDEKGKMTWSYSGLLDAGQYEVVSRTAYGKTKIYETFEQKDLNKKILGRTYEDVKEDLSEEATKLIADVETDANNLAVLYQNLNTNWLDVSMVDINDEKVAFKDYKGKKIIFEIMITSDEFTGSVTSAKNLSKYKSDDYVFMQLWLMDEKNTDLNAYLKTNKIDKTADHIFVLNDANNVPELSNIQVMNFPSQFFINEDFKIAGATQGAMTKKKFDKSTNVFFGETPLYLMGKTNKK